MGGVGPEAPGHVVHLRHRLPPADSPTPLLSRDLATPRGSPQARHETRGVAGVSASCSGPSRRVVRTCRRPVCDDSTRRGQEPETARSGRRGGGALAAQQPPRPRPRRRGQAPSGDRAGGQRPAPSRLRELPPGASRGSENGGRGRTAGPVAAPPTPGARGAGHVVTQGPGRAGRVPGRAVSTQVRGFAPGGDSVAINPDGVGSGAEDGPGDVRTWLTGWRGPGEAASGQGHAWAEPG